MKNLIVPNMFLIINILGLLLGCFLLFIFHYPKIILDDKHLPISGTIYNNLKVSENVKIELNDSTSVVLI